MNSLDVHVKTEKDNVVVLQGQAYRFSGTNYELDSINAIVELVTRKGDPQNTVIFYNDKEVGIILDDSMMERPQDKAIYKYIFSEFFTEWRGILDEDLSQKDFVKFLKRRPVEEVSVAEPLLAKVQNLKLLTEIVGDYKYDNNNNLTVMFKVKDKEDTVKLPTMFMLDMVLLKESDFVQTVEFELELSKPKSQDEKPLFTVTCPKLERYVKEATDYEIDRLKEELDDYLILAGKMQQQK